MKMSINVFVKIQYGSQIKFARVTAEENVFTHEDFCVAARSKFPDINHNIVFSDINGMILEPDVITDYVALNNTTDGILLKVQSPELQLLNYEPFSSQSTELSDTTSANSTTSVATGNDLTLTCESRSPICYTLTPKEIEMSLKRENSSKEIFAEYAEKGTLSNKHRKNLVNLIVAIMVELYGSHPTKETKISFAKAIVTLFPNLKDPATPEGYEAYYDPKNRSGYLSWRLRTLNRFDRSNNKENKSQKIQSVKLPNKNVNEVANVDTNEIKDCIEFMKNADPSDQNDAIFEKMKITFLHRRTLKENILTEYPRFLDTLNLINLDFELLYPNCPSSENLLQEFLNNFGDKIIAAYDISVINNEDKFHNTEVIPAFDHSTRIIIAMICMLPPALKGKKLNNSKTNYKKLIHFHKTGIPLDDIVKPTEQPFLVAIGSNRSAIAQYYISVDGKTLPIKKNSSFINALDTLFKCHFVLNVKYDSFLKSFWEYLEYEIYQISTNSNFTPKMREFRTRILNF